MTYCVSPSDKNVLINLTRELPLMADSRRILERSRLDAVTVDSRSGSCRIVLFVPELLPESDRLQVEKFLRQATCLEKLTIEQQLLHDPKLLCEKKEQLIGAIPQLTPMTRRALLMAEWQWNGGVLSIKLARTLEMELIQREGFEKSFPLFLHEQFGLTVQLEIQVVESAVCFDALDCMLQALPQDTAATAVSSNGDERGERTILGSAIKGKAMQVGEITEEQRNVIVQGHARALEVKELKSGRSLLSFSLEDATCAISCKAFFENSAEANKKFDMIKKGDPLIKVKGTVMFDRYVRELVLQADHISRSEAAPLEDRLPQKRVELHAHTQMSSMDSVVSVEGLIRTAEQYGHSAVAITDHGVVQAFPFAQEIAQKSKVKVIYGMEGYLFDQDISQSNHIIILAKNSQGLRNLYRLVSLAHIKFFHRTPRIPRSALREFREGLILGSACEAGEFYQAMLNGASEEELLQIANFYDFLEIQPCANNHFLIRNGQVADEEQLRAYNRRVCEIGRLSGRPVAAT